MSTVLVPITSSDSTVTRNVVDSIVKQLFFLTNWTTKDILFIERGGKAATNQFMTPTETLALENDEHAIVEYSETFDQATPNPTRYQTEYLPIFQIPQFGIGMTTTCSKKQLELKVTFKSKNYDKLSMWLENFKRFTDLQDPAHHHDINYTYTIPNDVVSYLYHVWYVIKDTVSPPITLHDFIIKHFAKGLGVRSNLSDTKKAIVMDIYNTGCLGFYTQIPEAIEPPSKEPPSSQITFTYVVFYDKVNAIKLDFQSVVANKKLDVSAFNKYGVRYPLIPAPQGLRTFTGILQDNGDDAYYDSIYFDPNNRWSPSTLPTAISTVLIVPIYVDVNDPYNVMNLHQLVDARIPPELMAILKKYWDMLTELYGFMFNLSLYVVGLKEWMERIIIDIELNIRTINNRLDYLNRYYLQISMVVDLLRLDFTRLQNDVTSLLYLLRLFDPTITVDTNARNSLKTIGNGTFVTMDSINNVISLITNTNVDTTLAFPKTVMTTHIIAG